MKVLKLRARDILEPSVCSGQVSVGIGPSPGQSSAQWAKSSLVGVPSRIGGLSWNWTPLA